MSFDTILVPLDGSRLGEAVLPVVVAFAKCSGAKIVLLHIIEENAPQTVHGEPHLTRAEEAEAYLDKLGSRYAGQLTIEHHVHGTQENNVAQSIAAHVEELGADLV